MRTGVKPDRRRVEFVQPNQKRDLIVVMLEGGDVQVNQVSTGELLYNNCNVPPLKFEHEVTSIGFFGELTGFWMAAGCTEGEVAFVSKPTSNHGRSYLKFKGCNSSHQRDVISLDINKTNHLVTASPDNLLCFWNSFTGEQFKKFQLPRWMASVETGKYI